jgi:hypothetical protein
MAIKKPSPLAWVGSITAVFSLIAGTYAGWSFLSRQIEKRHSLDQLLAAEEVQLRASDYESAWKTLAQAATVDPSSTRVQEAQEDVAMQWLDHIHVSGDQTFVSITERLEPVLTRGAAASKSPQRQADLLAHLGWSYFLRSREVPSSPEPEHAYREALAKDPANPYAHAMWGHWILWNHESAASASEHFAAALAAPRPNLYPYVRSMQLSAFNNENTSEGDIEVIRVVNDIRKAHGDLDGDWPHRILNAYWGHILAPNQNRIAFLSAVPPAEHLETYDWLLQRAGREEAGSLQHVYIRCALLEAAGRREEALAGYRTVLSRLGPNDRGSLMDGTRKAIDRLTAAR